MNILQAVSEAVSEVTGVSIIDISGRSRKAHVAHARALRSAVALQCTDLSLVQIGKAFGMDHSTIIYHRDRIEDEKEIYPEVDALFRSAYLKTYHKMIANGTQAR
jgi:chromosomal replication initiation ATPase DnaA